MQKSGEDQAKSPEFLDNCSIYWANLMQDADSCEGDLITNLVLSQVGKPLAHILQVCVEVHGKSHRPGKQQHTVVSIC